MEEPYDRNRVPFVLPEDIKNSGYETEDDEEEEEPESDESMSSESEDEMVVEERMCPFCSSVQTQVRPRMEMDDEIQGDGTCSLPIPHATYGPYRIFFDMEVNGNFVGRVIIKLSKQFSGCRNHVDSLCKGTALSQHNLTMHYTGTRIHRMEHGQFLEGGVLHPMHPQYMPPLYTEKPVQNAECYDSFIMVARKCINDDFGGARFIITTTNNVKHCDPDLVPVGCVVFGMDILEKMMTIPSSPTGHFNHLITIAHCGSIKIASPPSLIWSKHCENTCSWSTFQKKLEKEKKLKKKTVIIGSYGMDPQDMETSESSGPQPSTSFDKSM